MTLKNHENVCGCVFVDKFGVLFMVLWQSKDIIRNYEAGI